MNKNDLYTKYNVPEIVASSVYFWKPNRMANGRRNTEKKRIETVKAWLVGLGFEIIAEAQNSIIARMGEVEVRFEYWETCQHVYKRFSITRNGKRILLPSMLRMLQN